MRPNRQRFGMTTSFIRQGKRLVSLLTRAGSSFGWAAVRIRIGVRALVGAESYHVEIIGIPSQLKIIHATLGVVVTQLFVSQDSLRLNERILAEDNRGDGAHLYASRVKRRMVEEELEQPSIPDEERSATGFAEVNLRLKPRELFYPLALALGTTALLITGVALHKHGFRPKGEASTSLLVLVPGVVAAYKIPGDHPLVRRMFRGLLLPVITCALASFIAAGSLTVEASTAQRVLTWEVLAIASAASTCAILVAFLRSWLR
jgi:hypothetical protein